MFKAIKSKNNYIFTIRLHLLKHDDNEGMASLAGQAVIVTL